MVLPEILDKDAGSGPLNIDYFVGSGLTHKTKF